MTEQVKYSRRYLKAKLYIAIPSLLFICNALLCTIAGYHFEKQRVKYSPTSPNFPISPNNTCRRLSKHISNYHHWPNFKPAQLLGQKFHSAEFCLYTFQTSFTGQMSYLPSC